MCGIFAFASSIDAGVAVSKIALQGLELILNRGYDAIGLSVILEDNCIIVVKTVNLIDTYGNGAGLELLKSKWSQELTGQPSKDSFSICMAHSRWATHGCNSNENAHPHYDQNKQVAVIHNGIIENYLELKTSLIQESKCIFTSQTDTEVIPHLIAMEMAKYNKKEFSVCFMQTLQKLKGTWAFLVMNAKEPNRLYFAKNGSPLIVGFSEDSKQAFICSESSALMNLNCKRMITLVDGQCGYLEIIKNEQVKMELLNTSDEKIEKKITENIIMTSGNHQNTLIKKLELRYAHWMLQEIIEQKNILPRLLSGIDLETCNHFNKTLHEADRIYLFGCGTSYHAALFGERLFRYTFTNKFIQAIDASAHDDDFVESQSITDSHSKMKCVYIMLSQSGETKDIHRCLQSIRSSKKMGMTQIYALTNVTGSLIARDSDVVIDIGAGKEISVASTKSFTAQLCSLWKFISNQDVKVAPYINNYFNSKARDLCQNLAVQINELLTKNKSNSLFVLGRGWSEALAKEAALKIKEVSYIHAEAFSTSSLKHGPLSLITTGVPVLFLANCDNQYTKTLNSASEVKARGGYIVLITNRNVIEHGESQLFNEIIQIPLLYKEDMALSSVSLVFPCQLLAYYLSLVRKCNPDYPRNLAKTVTTD